MTLAKDTQIQNKQKKVVLCAYNKAELATGCCEPKCLEGRLQSQKKYTEND